MKDYKFLISKTREMEIDITAENHSEAMVKLLSEIVKKDKNFFIYNTNDNRNLHLKIQKIIDKNGKENEKDYEDFLKTNSFFLTKIDSDIEAENDEIFDETIDDLPREFGEIVCEKCGNCILIDENLLS